MTTKVDFKQSMIAGFKAAGASTVVNSLLFFIFHAAGILVDTIFIQPNQPLTVVPIIISSIVPTLIGTLVFFLLERYTKNGWKIFKIIALILMIITFVNPFVGIQGVTIGFAVVLDLMHVVVVGFLLFFIGKAVNKNLSY